MADVKIIDHTKEAIEAKDEAVERALEIIGGLMERYAKQNCPVDTGLLRNSITHATDGHRPSAERYHADSEKNGSMGIGYYQGEIPPEPDGKRSVVVGTNVVYARIIEFNEKMKHVSGRAHFIRDSVATHIAEYKKILERELGK